MAQQTSRGPGAPGRASVTSARLRTPQSRTRAPQSRPRPPATRPRPAQARRPTRKPARRGPDLRWLSAALLVAVGLLVVSLTQDWLRGLLPDEVPFLPAAKPCVATVGTQRVELDRDQAVNAATIAGVGLHLGMSERAVTVALATAMQESTLHNLDHGDRDSLGLFQQRPSQGWGTQAQVRDPVHAATKFYQGLDATPRWEDMSLTRAAQAVQRSGFPSAYAKHEPRASVLSAALTGHAEAALTCTTAPAKGALQRLTSSGLTARASSVRTAVERVWGRQSLGGFAPGGVDSGHIEGSAHYEGRAIDVFFRPVDPAHRRSGWALAHWLVANSTRLKLATVIYDDRIWTAARSKEGWRVYRSDDPTNAVKQHRDHVHVDVIRGT